jgi:recombination protein RecA
MATVRPAVPASTLSSFAAPAPEPAFGLRQLAGRIAELSGQGASARLTAAFGLVLEAQHRHEPAAWVTLAASAFFPPDAAAGGVDLASLSVVRVETARDAARAADQLVRSGSFGLVVLDLEAERASALPAPLLTRLMGLAQKHATAVLVLTEKPPSAPSLSSLVSLRAAASRYSGRGQAARSDGFTPARSAGGLGGCGAAPLPAHIYEVRVEVLKDKRRGPGGTHVESCHGPAGLR